MGRAHVTVPGEAGQAPGLCPCYGRAAWYGRVAGGDRETRDVRRSPEPGAERMGAGRRTPPGALGDCTSSAGTCAVTRPTTPNRTFSARSGLPGEGGRW